LIFVGDVVHQALPVAAIRDELLSICEQFEKSCDLVLLLGNHDRKLKELIGASESRLARSFLQEGTLFLHGDAKVPDSSTAALTVIGHEHPAVSLGDGITSAAKFPCFLVSQKLIVLPAFSTWVAGTSYGSYPFMSELARNAQFEKAVAIMGNKLLPIPLARRD
jgi:uncharacterized protein